MAHCYLRFRGEVTGPFEPAEVRRLYARELLTPAHEVSTDRQRWAPLVASEEIAADELASDEAEGRVEETGDSWSELLKPTACVTSATSDAFTMRLARGVSSRMARVTAVSCGVLIAFSTLLPVRSADGEADFGWGDLDLLLLSKLLTLLLALGAVVIAALPPGLVKRFVWPIVGGLGLLSTLLSPTGAMTTAIAWWQCIASGLAVALVVAAHRRRILDQRLYVVAAAILGIAGFISLAAAITTHALGDDVDSRFVVLHALRLVFVTAAWTSIIGVGLLPQNVSASPRVEGPT